MSECRYRPQDCMGTGSLLLIMWFFALTLGGIYKNERRLKNIEGMLSPDTIQVDSVQADTLDATEES